MFSAYLTTFGYVVVAVDVVVLYCYVLICLLLIIFSLLYWFGLFFFFFSLFKIYQYIFEKELDLLFDSLIV